MLMIGTTRCSKFILNNVIYIKGAFTLKKKNPARQTLSTIIQKEILSLLGTKHGNTSSVHALTAHSGEGTMKSTVQ